jgi:predicted nucleotidyltransferase
MTSTHEKVLTEMTEAIVQVADPETIILFGSYARGTADSDSDVDLLVVEKTEPGMPWNRRQETARIRRALSGFRVAKDILVYRTDEAAKWRHSVNHIIAHCYQEGKVLYERS